MRPQSLILLSALTVAAAATAAQRMNASSADASTAGRESQIERGFAIAPVTLDLRGKNRNLVGLGSYLVNAAGACNDCHTNPPYAPGGDPHQGQTKQINTANYMGGGMMFGPVEAANISPDAHGLPASHTFPLFVEIMRTGYSHHHPGLQQVMPWPNYRHLSDLELRAMYEYLKAIPHAEPGTGSP